MRAVDYASTPEYIRETSTGRVTLMKLSRLPLLFTLIVKNIRSHSLCCASAGLVVPGRMDDLWLVSAMAAVAAHKSRPGDDPGIVT